MDKDTLTDAKQDFKLCVDNESEQRKESLDDLRFARLGEQWPDAVVKQREREGRPCLTINRLPAFIKQVTNDARQNRPSITVHPVDSGADKETAEVLNGLIRNIQNVSRADIVYDTALDFAVTMGFGYWVIRDQYTCEDSFDKDLILERVSNPFAVYGDWESKEATSFDWNRAFITDMYSERAFKKRWPGASTSGFQEDHDEETALWFEDKRVRVAEYWTRDKVPVKLLRLSDGAIMYEDEYLKAKDLLDAEGKTVEGTRDTEGYKVTQRIISGTEVLETNPWKGRFIPIVPVYGDEINVDGKRYFQSLVRFAKDPQRMFNYWRTASTELVALAPKAPFIGVVGQFTTDNAKWQTANSATHAYIEADLVEGAPALPQRQPFTGVPAGVLQEALSSSQDLKDIMGLQDASLGKQSNETSGRAIMARQREGDVSTFNFLDNLTRAIEHTGAILVDLIPKHYDVARIIRCIKEDGTTYAVPINQPVIPQQGPEQMPGQPPQQFQPAEEHIEGVTRIFDLTTGKYDVTVHAGPSFTSRREESANQMMEFIRVFPQSAPLIGDLLAKNLDWPGADEVAARLRAMLPPQAQGGVNPMVQQLQQMLQHQDGMAKQAVAQLQQQIADLQAQVKDKTVENGLKTEELQVKKFEAETKRIDTQAKASQVKVDVDAQRLQQVEMPIAQFQQSTQQLDAIVATLGTLAQALGGMQQKPTKKSAKAVRQPDGSYLMESLEVPIEAIQ